MEVAQGKYVLDGKGSQRGEVRKEAACCTVGQVGCLGWGQAGRGGSGLRRLGTCLIPGHSRERRRDKRDGGQLSQDTGFKCSPALRTAHPALRAGANSPGTAAESLGPSYAYILSCFFRFEQI